MGTHSTAVLMEERRLQEQRDHAAELRALRLARQAVEDAKPKPPVEQHDSIDRGDESDFWALVDRTGGPDTCHPWVGNFQSSKAAPGTYPRPMFVLIHDGETFSIRAAARVACFLTFGQWPPVTRHVTVPCSGPRGAGLCLNPKHFLMTRAGDGNNYALKLASGIPAEEFFNESTAQASRGWVD